MFSGKLWNDCQFTAVFPKILYKLSQTFHRTFYKLLIFISTIVIRVVIPHANSEPVYENPRTLNYYLKSSFNLVLLNISSGFTRNLK